MARIPLATFLLLGLAAVHAAAGVTAVPESASTPQVNAGPGGVVTTPGPGLLGLSAPTLSFLTPALSPTAGPLLAPSAIVPLKPVTVQAAVKPVETRHLVFDVRGSRGGHGDVAAAYLTAYDVLDRTLGHKDAVTPKITFVAGYAERRILSRLSGRVVNDGDDLFDGFAKVYDPATLPAEHPPADVLMNLAAQGGEFSRHSDLRWAQGASAKDASIPVNERTVILTQTVFGNTESATNGPATALIAGRRLEMSHAGLARNDAGIYADPVARDLRGLPREKIRGFILAQTEKTDIGGTAAVAAILQGEVLAGAEVGLAYGISMKEVKPQFERYLAGLALRADRDKSAYVLVTPSSFKLEDIKSKSLRARVIIYEGDRVMPEVAEAGKIYVLKTGTLPHPLFVGLMAYSRPPPIVSGDGAMSAAVGLGRPFVLTKVEWNDLNIRTFAERLSFRAPPDKRALIKAVYLKSELERAGELEEITETFAAVSRAIPTLTDTMFAAAQAARDVASPEVTTDQLLGGVRDEILRASLLAMRSFLGDADAQEIAYEELRGSNPRTKRLLASALLRDVAGRTAFFKPVRALDFAPLNLLAAKLALKLSRVSARAGP